MLRFGRTPRARRTSQDYDLQQKLKPMMVDKKPLPSIYFPDFIAANQSERADNVLSGSKQEQMDQVRRRPPDR